MSDSVKPPSGGGTTHQSLPVVTQPPVKGQTARARSVEIVDPDPQHTDLNPEPEHPLFSDRDVRPHPPTPLLKEPEGDEDDEDEDEFFDAQEDFQLTEAHFEAVEAPQPPPPIPQSTRVQRFFAVFLAWGMERGKIKAKVSTNSSTILEHTKNKIREYKELLKSFRRHPDKPDKIQSKMELAALKKEKEKAEEARSHETVGYIQFFSALKKIFSGQMDQHQMHLDGLTLGGGKVSLNNVDLTTTQVDLIDGPDGTTTPQITANLTGELELPLEGKPPLKIKLNMTGVRISLEGRMIPAANAWIGKYGVKQIWRQVQKIRKGKGKLFSLRHVGVKAESIKATLVNPDSETLAELVTRMKSTRGRAIDKIFTSLGLPLDCEIGELEVHTSSTSNKPKPPLLTIKTLKTQYDPSDLPAPNPGSRTCSSGRDIMP